MSEPEEQQRGADEQGRGRSSLTWLISVAIIALLLGLYFVLPGYREFVDRAFELVRSGESQELQEWISGFGFWGPLLIIALMLAQTLLAFIPSLLIMVAAVLAYGPWWGGLLSWGGLLIAATLAYFIGRALGSVAVDRLIGHEAEKRLEAYVERYGVWGVVVARISPALSTDAVSYAAGLVGMRFERFILATAAGILPLAALISFLGEDWNRLKSGLIWVSVVSLIVLVGYVIYDQVWGSAKESG